MPSVQVVARCLVVSLIMCCATVTNVALALSVAKRSASSNAAASCMVSWLQLTPGINSLSEAQQYERAFKLFGHGIDESNAATSELFPVSVALGSSQQRAEAFISCITRRTESCQASAPCRHGGQCLNLQNNLTAAVSYRCRCRDGYAGEFCESEVPSCARRPCQNGGTCTPDDSDYYCNCPPLFSGRHCEERWLTADKFEQVSQAVANLGQTVKMLQAAEREAQSQNARRVESFLRQLERTVQAKLGGGITSITANISLLAETVKAVRTSQAQHANDVSAANSALARQAQSLATLGRKVEAEAGKISQLQRKHARNRMLYDGVELFSFALTRNTDIPVSVVGCERYVPRRSWSLDDFKAICKHFRTSDTVSCDRLDADKDGGNCSNFFAVLSFESKPRYSADVWVNQKAFRWDPASERGAAVSSCKLRSDAPTVVVYACRP